MIRRFLPAVVLMLVCCASSFAQDKGPWRAASTTAKSITGDIAIGDTKISIDFSNFTIAQIRSLGPAEGASVFDVDSNGGGAGNLYRLNIPGDRRFLHRNTLCGSEDTQWMATYLENRQLHVAFFSSANMPVFKTEAMTNSSDLCGTFLYVR